MGRRECGEEGRGGGVMEGGIRREGEEGSDGRREKERGGGGSEGELYLIQNHCPGLYVCLCTRML